MKVLIAGRDGQLAHALAQHASKDTEIVAVGRPDLDLRDPSTIDEAFGLHRLDVVVNAAAYTFLDQAARESDLAFAVNRDSARHVATATARPNLPVAHVSTDYVFGGTMPEPYIEGDKLRPQSAYGCSTRDGEIAALGANTRSAIIWTSWVCSPWGRNFALTMLRLAAERYLVRVVADQNGSPTYEPDLASAILAANRRLTVTPGDTRLYGIFQVANAGATIWAGFAEEIFRRFAARVGPSAHVEPITTVDSRRRPIHSS